MKGESAAFRPKELGHLGRTQEPARHPTVDAFGSDAYPDSGTALIFWLTVDRGGLPMPTFLDVLSAARTLNTTERIRLANAIWEDVPPADWPVPDAEWIAEAQRRSAEYDEGRMSAATWPEVQARARRGAGLDG